MKKRILAALLLCPTLLLTSCDKVSEKDVQKDPVGMSVTAMSLNFDETETTKELKNTLEATSMRMSMEMETPEGTLAFDVYGDEDNSRGAFEIKKGIIPTDIALYFNDKEFAIKCDDLSETPVGAKYDDLNKDAILNSTFASAMGITEAELGDDFFESLDQIRGMFSDVQKFNKDADEKFGAMLDEMKKALSENGCTVTAEKLELQDGTVPAIVTAFDINEDTLDALCDILMDTLGEINYPAATLDELRSGLDTLVDEFADSVDSLVLKTGIVKKTGALVWAELYVDAEGGETTVSLDLGSDPKKSEMYVLTIDADGESGKIEYLRSSDENEFSRTAKVYSDDEKQGEVSFTWNKSAGNYALVVKDADETEIAELSGDLTIKDNFLRVSFDGTEDVPQFAFEIETGVEVPEVPEYQSFLNLNEDDVNDIIINYYMLAGGFSDFDYGDTDYSDYDWDDEDWDDEDWDDEDWDDDTDWDSIDWSDDGDGEDWGWG